MYASEDTDEIVRQKGFIGGFHTLLRPYGENSRGTVTIRDSLGGSKSHDDFGVRVVGSQELRRASMVDSAGQNTEEGARVLLNGPQNPYGIHNSSRHGENGSAVGQLLNHYMCKQVSTQSGLGANYSDHDGKSKNPRSVHSYLYPMYLRKLLSSQCLAPQETFSHPVACMIAVSTHHSAPIEALRQLYANTGHSGNNTPAWVGTECLRYYVLIHDEEHDDITKTTVLFDSMKRHFGLHCHLLRLRTSPCVQTDDDTTKVPVCEWLSAEEELNQLCSSGKSEHDVKALMGLINPLQITPMKLRRQRNTSSNPTPRPSRPCFMK